MPVTGSPALVCYGRTTAAGTGPKTPSIAPAQPKPVLSTPWSSATTGPRDPDWSVGDASRYGWTLLQVIGPTMPSTTSPFACWKSRTAWSVFAPKVPSTSAGASSLARANTRCSRLTSSPVSPSLIVAGMMPPVDLEVLLDELSPGERADDGVGGEMGGRLEGEGRLLGLPAGGAVERQGRDGGPVLADVPGGQEEVEQCLERLDVVSGHRRLLGLPEVDRLQIRHDLRHARGAPFVRPGLFAPNF